MMTSLDNCVFSPISLIASRGSSQQSLKITSLGFGIRGNDNRTSVVSQQKSETASLTFRSRRIFLRDGAAFHPFAVVFHVT